MADYSRRSFFFTKLKNIAVTKIYEQKRVDKKVRIYQIIGLFWPN